VQVEVDGEQMSFSCIAHVELTLQSAVALVGEADRKMLKAAIKHSAGQEQIKHRVIPSATLTKWATALEQLTDDVAEVLKEEKEEKQVGTPSTSLRDYLMAYHSCDKPRWS
jgi:hypothetical protein